jgi:hypothetical protein
MKQASYLLCGVLPFLLMFVLLSSTLFSSGVQIRNQSSPLPGEPHPLGGSSTEDVWQEQQRKEIDKRVNIQRQDEIRRDTEKLLELATELKQAVDKSNEHTLSLDVIKKAEQIEKLAKSVKEKMKGP